MYADMETSHVVSLDLAMATYNESTYLLEQIQNRALALLAIDALVTIGLASFRPDMSLTLLAILLILALASGILSVVCATISLVHGAQMLPGPESKERYRQLSYGRESDSYANAMNCITDAITTNVSLINERGRIALAATIFTMIYAATTIALLAVSAAS